jgi:hypothetical protein
MSIADKPFSTMTDSDAVESTNPLDRQRELMNLLSHEIRHQIIQVMLGHPAHLPSTAEFDYFLPDTTPTDIGAQLDRLREAEILDEYTFEAEHDTDVPHAFYGPTEYGIKVLGEFNYLRGVPIAQAVIQQTKTTETIDQYMAAPRPSLPADVRDALRLKDNEENR